MTETDITITIPLLREPKPDSSKAYAVLVHESALKNA